ncbi:MAG: hypothetical protein WD894_23840 [Pirellulales bacterium]
MSAISRTSLQSVCWRPALRAAAIGVGGALAMTVVLAAVAMLAAAVAGVPAQRVPTLLTSDVAFPWFCAAAGVFTALLAGYITARNEGGVSSRNVGTACMLTVAGHMAVVGVLGSPLAPVATATYIACTLPALCLGCYFGAPVRSLSA